MERLIHSSLSSKTLLNPLIFPRNTRINGPSSAFWVSSNNSRPVRLDFPSSRFFKHDPSPLSLGFSIRSSTNDSSPADLPVRSQPMKPFRELAIETLSGKTVPTGAIVLLTALIVFLIQPTLAPPAFATAQTAAKTLVRTDLLNSAWTGFFAGCLHTLSGPDHLAALAPLSIGRTRMESAAVGALWGCGHDAGQVIFGLLFLLLKDRLHIEVIRTWGAIVVGLTLLIIGAMGIKEAFEVPTPCIALGNGECEVGIIEPIETRASGGKKKIGLATFATGIVHGLQPDALLMVLPALALPSRLAGAAFLGMFLIGTVFAMGSFTVFIGSCSQALKERVPRITEKLSWGSSLVAIGLGLAILISQFFGFNLY